MDINNRSIPLIFVRKITLVKNLIEKLNSSSIDTYISFDLDRTTLLTDDDYLTNLYNYLLSIRSLFVLKLDDSLPTPIQKKIEECVENLINQDLLEKLIALLDSQKLFESSYKILDIEIKVREITSEIIYQICYQIELTNSQSIKICELLYDISSIYCENKNENVYKLVYRLLCSVIAFLRFNPKRKVLSIKDMNDNIEEFTLFDYINRVWTFKDIEIILNLLYGLYLIKDKRAYFQMNEDNEYIAKAISNNFSEALLSIMTSDVIRNDNSMTKFTYVIDELISCFIMVLPSEVNRMKNNDNSTSNFKYFMNLIAFTYRDEPSLTQKYWHQGLISIISISLEVISTRFDDCIDMLISLSSGETSSLQLYEFLDEVTNNSFGWFKIFKMLETFSHDMKKNYELKQNGVKGEIETDIKISNIYSILKLIGSIAKYSDISREKFFRNTYFMLPNSLANILKYSSDNDLKSEVFKLLEIFAKDTNIQSIIWNLLLKNDLLPRSMSSKDGDGNNDICKSGAFLSLLNTLFEDYQPSSQNNPYIRIWNITEIINTNLLSIYDIRSSFYVKDKSNLISESLRWNLTVLRIIEYYDYKTIFKILKEESKSEIPNSDAGASLKLYLEYLYESRIQEMILKLICDFVSSDREQAHCFSILEYSLSILDIVISRVAELNSINSKLKITDEKRLPLNKIISQNNYICSSIVKCITFDNQCINRLSVSILRRLTQSKSKLKNLIEVFKDASVASAYADKFIHIFDSLSYSKLSLCHAFEVDEVVTQEILLLLIENSPNSLPNLTYTLLFEHGNKKLAEKKKDPYILLHYIIKILNHPIIYYVYPSITSLCYELIYKLQYYSPTQPKTLSALKSNGFYIKQLSKTPVFDPMNILENLNFPIDLYEDYVYYLKTEFIHQKSWLTKSVGLYLHICQSKDEEYVLRIIEHLFLDNSKRKQYMNLLLEPFKQPIIENREQLYSIVFPSFNYWELTKEPNNTPINIDLFYSLLLKQIKFSDGNYNPYIEKEKKRLLTAAYNYNKTYDRNLALSNLLQSWNQVLEVSFFECGRFLTDYTNKFKFEMIEVLFNILQGKESISSIGEIITRSIFTLLSRTDTSETLDVKSITSIQKKSLKILLFAKISDTMRQNIYGILLTILRIVKILGEFNKEEKKSPLVDLMNNLNINESSSSSMTIDPNNMMIVDKVISGFNFASDKIVQVIVQDCNKDVPSLSSLAVATLDSIINIDKSLKWINSLNSNNQLKMLTYKIMKMNDKLSNSITPHSSISDIMVFENIASLIISLMRSEMRANVVLESGIIRVLSECDFIERKPKSILLQLEMERYELLMLPVFRIITSILVHIPRNPKVDSEVENFILYHFDVILEILKDEVNSKENTQLSLIIMISYMILLLLNRNSDDSSINSEQFYKKIESLIYYFIPIFIQYSEQSYQKNEDGVIELNMPILAACKNMLMIFRIMIDKESIDDAFIEATLNYLTQLMIIYDAIKNVMESIKIEYKTNVNDENYDPELLEYDYSIKKNQSDVILSNIELILILATEIKQLAIPISENAESFLKLELIDQNTINIIPELIENIKVTSEFDMKTKLNSMNQQSIHKAQFSGSSPFKRNSNFTTPVKNMK